jgi:cysteine synthase A
MVFSSVCNPLSTESAVTQRLSSLLRVVGNTPLLGIECEFRGRRRVIYAKCEHLNLTGSIKDRMALHILRRAYETGSIRPGDRIVEATSGNTGISFAALGRALGHPVTIFMPNWMSRERTEIIHSFGAAIVKVSHEEGGFLGCIARAEEMAAGDSRVFLPRQFSNENNAEAHEVTTGPEIQSQLEDLGLRADAFVAGVGTGGTVMGVGRYLRSKNPRVRVHPVEPAESPTLSTGCCVGNHRIQGISDEFIPAIVKLDEVEYPLAVHDGDAIIMAQKFASELGLAVGISSGANFLAALMAAHEIGNDATVVTVFADDNKKYLSTALLQHEPVKEGFLSNDVELLHFSATKRVCAACGEVGESSQG